MSRLAISFEQLIHRLRTQFLTAPLVHAPNWQSTTAPDPMAELFNQSFSLDLFCTPTREFLAEAIRPNLPWADNHFDQERVSGEPINPGETWKQWPYAHSAARHLREDGDPDEVAIYDHSYAERYWPKMANRSTGGHLTDELRAEVPPMGIRFPIGDLEDVVKVLVADPLTRQAYLPIWFPEDIAAARLGKRVPCTLGYHLIRRTAGNGKDYLHLVYPMRSCDFVRHFRDDVYLTILLQLWVLEQCRLVDPQGWNDVDLGTFRMHITSLHMFKLDQTNLRHAMERKEG